MFFDGDAVYAIEFHCHGTSSSEGVAAGVGGREATLFQVQKFDGSFKGAVDV